MAKRPAPQSRRQVLSLAAVALAAGWHPPGVSDDRGVPVCELCGPAAGWELDAELGVGYVSDDEFHFGDYTGLDGDGPYAVGNVFGRLWTDDARYGRIEGHRLGQDSRALFLEAGRQGLYQLRASYQEIPRRINDTAATPFRNSTSERRGLPDDWVRANTTQGMSTLDDSLRSVKIERDWDVYEFGVSVQPVRRWDVAVDYRRLEKDGRNVQAGSFFFQSSELSGPVDWVTDEVEASAAYSADNWQLRVAYLGSFFDNGDSTLSWDNPYSPQAPGADEGRLALAPDNEAHQFSLSGSMVLPARTVVSGHASFGRMEQDESLLSYTVNDSIQAASPPKNSADAQVDTTDLGLRVNSTPLQALSLEGRFRYWERDNDTPERSYDYVVTDLFNSLDPARNIAYDYKRFDYRLQGEYRLPARTNLQAGYRHQKFERDHQEREDTNTDRLWAKLRSRHFSFAEGSLEVYGENRSGSDYDPIEDVPDPQNRRMRKYNMASRDRHGFRTYVSFYQGERSSLGLDAAYNQDKYHNSKIGLRRSRSKTVGLDGSYLFNERVSAYASIYADWVKSRQQGSQGFDAADWTGRTEDTFYTATVGLNYPRVISRLGMTLEYSYAKSKGEVDMDVSGLPSGYPNLSTALHQTKLGFDYPISRSLNLNFGYMYTKYDQDDWAIEDLNPDTVSNYLALGPDPYDYDVHSLFLSARYMFDSRGQSGPRLSAD